MGIALGFFLGPLGVFLAYVLPHTDSNQQVDPMTRARAEVQRREDAERTSRLRAEYEKSLNEKK